MKPYLFLLCLLSNFLWITSPQAKQLPFELFMEGIGDDERAADAYQLRLCLHHLQRWVLDEGLQGNAKDTALLRLSQMKPTFKEENWVKENLASLEPDITNASSRIDVLKIIDIKISDTNTLISHFSKRARDWYRSARDLNETYTTKPFIPANLFAEAISTVLDEEGNLYIKPKGSRTLDAARAVATLLAFGITDIKMNKKIALLWFYRAAMAGDAEAYFQFVARLTMHLGITFSQDESLKHQMILRDTIPDLIPILNPHVGGKENVFRGAAFSGIFLTTYTVLFPLLESLLLGLDAADFPVLNLVSSFFASLMATFILEHNYQKQYDYNESDLRKFVQLDPLHLASVVATRGIYIDQSSCSCLLEYSSTSRKAWAEKYLEQKITDFNDLKEKDKNT